RPTTQPGTSPRATQTSRETYRLPGVRRQSSSSAREGAPDMSTSSRVLAALLRAGDRSTLQRLERALKASRGSVSDAAAALGLPVSTLYALRRAVPAAREVLEAHAMGRSGAQARAVAARKTRVISRGSEKVRKK